MFPLVLSSYISNMFPVYPVQHDTLAKVHRHIWHATFPFAPEDLHNSF